MRRSHRTAGRSDRQRRPLVMRTKLNQTTAETLQPRDRAYICYDQSPCRVAPGGGRAWIFEYRPGGGRKAATRRMTLGRVDALPYAKARKAAEVLYHRTRLGEDPAAAETASAPPLPLTRSSRATWRRRSRRHVSRERWRYTLNTSVIMFLPPSDVSGPVRLPTATSPSCTAQSVLPVPGSPPTASAPDQFVVHLGWESWRGPARH